MSRTRRGWIGGLLLWTALLALGGAWSLQRSRAERLEERLRTARAAFAAVEEERSRQAEGLAARDAELQRLPELEREAEALAEAAAAERRERDTLAAELHGARVRAAQLALASGDVGAAREELDAMSDGESGFERAFLRRAADARVRAFEGHERTIYGVDASADGRLVATGSMDETARVWDAATGEARFVLEGHRDTVLSVAFSPDARFLVTGGDDRTWRLWFVETGELVRKGELGAGLWSVAFAPDGARFACGDSQGELHVVDAATGEVQRTVAAHEDQVNALDWCGTRILSGSDDGRVVLTDLDDGTVRTLDLAEPWVRGVTFCGDGDGEERGALAIVARDDGSLTWLATDAEGADEASAVLHRMRPHTDAILGLDYAPDERLVVTGSYDGTLRFFDVERREERRVVRWGGAVVEALAVGRSAGRVFFGAGDRRLHVLSRTAEVPRVELAGEFGVPTACALDVEAGLVGLAAEDGWAVAFDFDGAELARIQAHEGHALSVALAPGGRLLASGGSDGRVVLTELPDEAPEGRLEPRTRELGTFDHAVVDLGFDPQGETLTAVAIDGAYRVYRVADGEVAFERAGLRDGLLCLSLDRSAERLTWAGGGGVLRVWDVASGAKLAGLRLLQLGRVSSIVASAEVDRMACVTNFTGLRFFTMGTGEFLHAEDVVGYVEALELDPAGRRVFCGLSDGTVRVFDLARARELLRIDAVESGVKCVALSADGRGLAAAGKDRVTLFVDNAGEDD